MAAFFALIAGLAIGALGTVLLVSWSVTSSRGVRDLYRSWFEELDRQDF